MQNILPNPIPGSNSTLSDTLTVNFLTNRTLALHIGASAIVVLTTEEVDALYKYLHGNKRIFFATEESR